MIFDEKLILNQFLSGQSLKFNIKILRCNIQSYFMIILALAYNYHCLDNIKNLSTKIIG